MDVGNIRYTSTRNYGTSNLLFIAAYISKLLQQCILTRANSFLHRFCFFKSIKIRAPRNTARGLQKNMRLHTDVLQFVKILKLRNEVLWSKASVQNHRKSNKSELRFLYRKPCLIVSHQRRLVLELQLLSWLSAADFSANLLALVPAVIILSFFRWTANKVNTSSIIVNYLLPSYEQDQLIFAS